MQVCSLIKFHRANKQKGVAHLHSLCVFLNKSLQLCHRNRARERDERERERERREGGGRASRSWSAPNFQHEPFSSASWPSCRARGHVPPFTTSAHPYLPTPLGENHYQIESASARGAVAAAASPLGCVYDAKHTSGTSSADTNSARTRLQTHNHLRAVCLSLRGFSV